MSKGEKLAAPIVLSLGEILELYNVGIGNLAVGHTGLNGYQKAVGDKIIFQPYSLTDEVRQKITQVRFVLRPYFDEVDKELRAQITREVMGTPARGTPASGEEGKPGYVPASEDFEPAVPDPAAVEVPENDTRRQAQWARLYSQALKVKHTVAGLHVFQRSDFFRENRNPIPNVVEIALYPITEGSPWRLKYCAPAATSPEGGE